MTDKETIIVCDDVLQVIGTLLMKNGFYRALAMCSRLICRDSPLAACERGVNRIRAPLHLVCQPRNGRVCIPMTDTVHGAIWIDWGNGTVERWTGDDVHRAFMISKAYAAKAGTYNVRIFADGPNSSLGVFGCPSDVRTSDLITAAWTQYLVAFVSLGDVGIASLNGLFDVQGTFNLSLNHLDVSRVKTMESMFEGALAFNQPLNQWNVSNVKNMRSMLF